MSLLVQSCVWCWQAQTLLATQQVDLQVLGITNTKKMLLSDTGIDLNKWTEAWESKGAPDTIASRLGGIS